MVVYKSGQSQGIDNSANIMSKSQSIAIFITMEKRPSVNITKGRARAFKIGLTKKFRSPRIIPKTKKICHWAVMGNWKKFESGYVFTTTPKGNSVASHNPAIALSI